jgi:hypothetical protein
LNVTARSGSVEGAVAAMPACLDDSGPGLFDQRVETAEADATKMHPKIQILALGRIRIYIGN